LHGRATILSSGLRPARPQGGGNFLNAALCYSSLRGAIALSALLQAAVPKQSSAKNRLEFLSPVRRREKTTEDTGIGEEGMLCVLCGLNSFSSFALRPRERQFVVIFPLFHFYAFILLASQGNVIYYYYTK
jgi:hypothetical protein